MPENDVSPDRILSITTGYRASKVLQSAAKLGLFTELAKGPLDSKSLAERLELDQRGARDFFDALVALGMLRRSDEDGRYSNTPESDYFLDGAKPTYIGGYVEWNDNVYRSWVSFIDALHTGKPQNHKADENFFSIYSDPEKMRVFLRGMRGFGIPTGKALAGKFPWQEHETFFDVGAAEGAVPVEIAMAHEHLTGGGFDLPAVRPFFEGYVKSFGLGSRLRFVAGDFFKDPLPASDVIIMGRVLHDWDLEQKLLLIKKAYEALSDRGALIVYENLIDDDRRANAAGLLASLNMLVLTQGGFDYTGRECSDWMKSAGFRKTYVEHLAGPDWMIVGLK